MKRAYVGWAVAAVAAVMVSWVGVQSNRAESGLAVDSRGGRSLSARADAREVTHAGVAEAARPIPQRVDAERVMSVLSVAPELDLAAARDLLAQSDRAKERAQQWAVLEEGQEADPGARVREAFGSWDNPKEELLAYFDSHREIFGDRTFEESRYSVDRLLRVEKTRAALGID